MLTPFIGDDTQANAIAIATSAANFTIPNGFGAVELHNDGSETVFYRIGAGVTATAADSGNSTIGAGMMVVRGVPKNGPGEPAVRISAIGAAGGGKLRIVPGNGL